jgi:hypothetical protein
VKELSVSLARMPVFARAGAVVPTQPYRPNEAAPAGGPLVITAWAGGDGAFRLYEDAGDGLDYKRRHAFTGIAHDDRGAAGTRVTIGKARGDYAGRPRSRAWDLRVVGVARPSAVTVAGKPVDTWAYDEATRTVTVRTPQLATSRSARIDLQP